MKAVRIETSPFQVLALVEFESVLKKNQHGCAKVSGYISAEEKDQLMAMISEETWAHIWFYDETGEKNILFCGYIEDLRIHAEADTFLLTALLKTGTGKMDMGEHIGVYQNGTTSCQKILETIVQGYTDGKLLMGTEAGNIGKMVVQYKETDWEFAKRLAAQKNTVIMANEKSAGVKYTFGIPEEAGRELLSYEAYSIMNLIGEYQIKKNCGMSESDAVAYQVKTREIFYLGDFVRFLGRNYVVGEVRRKWEGNEVYNYYLLETKGELRQVSYGNKKIIGASLKGNVKEEWNRLNKELGNYRMQYRSLQTEKDTLYENYAVKQIEAGEYRSRADGIALQMQELSRKIEETELAFSRLTEEYNQPKQDMKEIIRFSQMEKLTQEAVDVFIKKVIIYRDKRVEIEWNYAFGEE